MGVVYGTSNVLLKGALHIFGDWKVEGREYVPPKGPLIIVSNHQSNMDPPILAVSIPRRINFMAKRGLFHNPVASLFLKAYGAFPLNQSGNDLAAIQRSLKMLSRGAALVIFPEGTRSPGAIRKAIPGIAMIALRSGAPILPVGITGTESIGPPWQIAIPRGEFKVRIGQPFSVPPMEGKVIRGQLEVITTMIMERVAALLPESYRGVYALKENGAFSEVGSGENGKGST
ncbi:MAG: lysophospholipid acyltransferase family protein [Chloroflexota bacterium]